MIDKDVVRMANDIAYYDEAEKWLMEQGCNIDIYWGGQESLPVWESEDKKIEFMLRWM